MSSSSSQENNNEEIKNENPDDQENNRAFPSNVHFATEAAYLTSPTNEDNNGGEASKTNVSQEKSIVESNLKKLSEKDGRWEYLYQLNKLKKIKNHYIKEIVQKDQIDREKEQCTFSPKTNKSSKILQGYSQSSKNVNTNIDRSSNFSPLSFNYNSNRRNKKSIPPHPKTELPPAYQRLKEIKPLNEISKCDMFERQKILEQNKKEKIQVLKSMEFEKEYSECFFRPRINTPYTSNRDEKDVGAVNFVADPISYENYIARLEKFRSNKAKMEKENKKKLNIKDVKEVQKKNIPRILNEIHSPRNEKYFLKKDLDQKETIKIKSLNKPLEEHRYKRPVNNVYTEKVNKDVNAKGSNKSVSYLKDNTANKMIDLKGPILYNDALKFIRNQLHAIEFEESI